MAKPKPNTAEVTLIFRVRKGVTAAQARHLIWNNVSTCSPIYTDMYEEEVFGGEVRFRVGKGRIIRPAKA